MKTLPVSGGISIEALKAMLDRGNNLLDFINTIIIIADSEGRVTFINKKGCEILGLGQDEVVGKSWIDEFVPLKSQEEFRKYYERVMAGTADPPSYYGNLIKAKDGERNIAWNASFIRDGSGKIIGSLNLGTDMTESMKLEERIRVRNLGSKTSTRSLGCN